MLKSLKSLIPRVSLKSQLIRNFSTSVASEKRTHGGLSDKDRIFTNIYRDGDPFIEGALKRVIHKLINRGTGIKQRTSLSTVQTG